MENVIERIKTLNRTTKSIIVGGVAAILIVIILLVIFPVREMSQLVWKHPSKK